jgi:hypothetical protein
MNSCRNPVQVAVLSSYESESVINLSLIDRLLEAGVNFTGFLENQLPQHFSEELLEYPLLLIDQKSLKSLTAEQRCKLERYAADHFVYCFDYLPETATRMDINMHMEIWVNHALAVAGLQGDTRNMPEQSPAEQIRFVEERSAKYLAQPEIPFSEFTVHALRGMNPDSESLGTILAALFDRQDIDQLPPHHDALAAWMYAPLCSELTGEKRHAERFLQVMDKIMQRRPYTPEGILAGSGDISDPLNFNGEFPSLANYTTGGRMVVDLEMFHFHAPLFASAARMSHNPVFLDQLARLMRHLRTVNCDPVDHLPCHYSRNGMRHGAKWSRGTAHVLHGLTLTLEMWPEIPLRGELVAWADSIGEGLLECQSEDGCWHNILDIPITPLETSGTMAFLCSFGALIKKGLLEEEKYGGMIERARHALLRRCWRGGFAGNCAGTGLAPGMDYYVRRPFNFLFTGQLAAALRV